MLLVQLNKSKTTVLIREKGGSNRQTIDHMLTMRLKKMSYIY
jgi:hypothetical protein